LFKVKLAVVTVEEFMALVKDAEIEAFTETPLELLAGLVDTMAGGDVSVAAAPPAPPPQLTKNIGARAAKWIPR
jgi:hypothetical protein